MDKVIVTVAVTGGQTTKEQNPNLPITPQEIADAALECFNEGASIVHIHVRDPKTGGRTMELGVYKDVFERIRSKSKMIINLSTGPGGQLTVGSDNQPVMEKSIMATPEKRVEHVLALKPEFCSLDIGSSNAGFGVFVNAQHVIDKMAELIKRAGVKPEIEIFDPGNIQIAKRLMQIGLVDKTAHFQLCMGTKMGIGATAKDVVYLADLLPTGTTWSLFGVGAAHFPMVAMGVVMGGHVRVGMEDNVYLRKGVLCKSNAELVKQTVAIIRSLNKEPATLEEARKILSLS